MARAKKKWGLVIIKTGPDGLIVIKARRAE